MSDEKPDITLIQRVPRGFIGDPTSLDWQLEQGFVRRQQAREEAEWAAALTGGPGGEVSGAPTEEPKEPEKPSALAEGAKAGIQTFTQAGQAIKEGLFEMGLGPNLGADDPRGVGLNVVKGVQAVKKIVVDGILSMGMAPFVAMGVAGGQALENENPGLAASELLPRSSAYFLRRMIAAKAESAVTPEEREAWAKPMSVREGLETAIQLGAPLAAAPVAKGAAKVAENVPKGVQSIIAAPERGAVGKGEPSFTPKDPVQLERFVRSHGGLKADPLDTVKGEYSELPLRFKSKKGMTAAEMAEAIAEESGQPYDSGQLMHDLIYLKREKDRVKARDSKLAEVEREVPAEAPDVVTSVYGADLLKRVVQGIKEEPGTAGHEFASDMFKWIAQAVDDAGGPEAAKAAVRALPDDSFMPTPSGRRMGKTDQLALLEYAFPEEGAAHAPVPRAATEGEGMAGGGGRPTARPGGRPEGTGGSAGAAPAAAEGGGAGGGVTPPPAPPSAPPPPPEGPAPRANMGRVGAEPEVKALIADLDVKAQQAGIIRKQRISHEETAALAEGKDLTIERALKLDYADLHVNATAVRDLRDHAFKELRELEIRANALDAEALAKLPNATVIAALLEVKAVEVAEAAGRGLSSFNIISDAARAYDRASIVKLSEQIKAGMLPGDSLALRLQALRTKQQRQAFLRQMVSGAIRGQNVFYEAWINGLLSNPVTHAANIASNSMVAAWGIAERQMAGMFNLIRHDPEGVHIGEAAVMTRAAVRATAQASRVALRALTRGEEPFGVGKMEVAPALTSERMGLAPENPMAGVVDFMGSGIRLPSRLLVTEDAFFKWFNYTLDLEAQAYREGKARGLSGDELGAFRRQYVQDNALSGSLADLSAQRYASLQTFTKELTPDSIAGRVGEVGYAFQRLPLMRLIAPFMRTPINIGEYAWQRLPGVGLISESLYRELAAGGAQRDLAVARLGTSALLAAAFMEYASAGLVTGAGVDRGDTAMALKELGRQNYAVRSGDELYTINRLDPAGLMIGSLATYAEIAGRLPEGARAEYAMALVLAISEGIKDKPYFMGLATAIEAIENPSAGTKKIVESYTRSLVPAGVRQLKKSGIPGILEGDATKRATLALTAVEEFGNRLKADIPGFSRDLPPELNPVTGEPIVYPPGYGPDIFSPVLVTKLKGDPVFEAIARNKAALREVPKAIAGKVPSGLQMTPDAKTEQGIPLTAEERHRLTVILTKEIKDGQGRNVHQALRALVESETFKSLQVGKGSGQKAEIEKLYGKYMDLAVLKFRQEHPAIDEAVREVLENKLIRRRGPAESAPPPFQIAPGMVVPGARQ